MKTGWELYVITDRGLAGGRPVGEVVRQALEGGAEVIQLREKTLPTGKMVELAAALKELTQAYGARVIVNDRLDVALAVDADGVHLGQEDMPARIARRLLGPEKLLGVSVSSVEEALRAVEDGADYVGAGAVFPTATKGEAGVIGIEGLRAIAAAVDLPVVAIGGIDRAKAAEVIAAGAAGVAVVSAVMAAPDPKEAAREILSTVVQAARARAGRT
ncbi:MAG: thiamine phosphate synthase [Firmicutes bacterium]|nr:thiamine phosphate synthase [Bacillota bacterium]